MTDTPSPDERLPWVGRVLIRAEVGSTAHGTGLPGGEDYDEMGVMIDPWQSAVGLHPDPDTVIYRPGRQMTDRSQPGDYDLVVYTARKFAQLCVKGNPSVLMLLFGPLRFSTPLGDALRALAPAFWSDQARLRFLGYSQAQRERLLGVRGGKHTNRPELIAQHGYDTKFAMHMLRLGLQGMEYAQHGRLTLPIPGEAGELLRAVRRGEYALDRVIAMADANEDALRMMGGRAPLMPDVGAINEWLRAVHMEALETVAA